MPTPTTLFCLALVALYLAVFGEASIKKLADRRTPSWFVDQFKGTWLGRIPPGPQWWTIAALELATAVTFGASVAVGEPWSAGPRLFLGYGLLLAAAVFSMLCFGLRVASDFAGSASAFAYSALTLLLWHAVHTLP